MAQFSSSDINEAKRRVKEMQEKARSYSRNEPSRINEVSNEENKEKAENENNSGSSLFGSLDFISNLFGEEDGSKGIILALILILAREKADNMLILALLYILL